MLTEELNGRRISDREVRLLLRDFFRDRCDSKGEKLTKAAVCTPDNIEVVRAVELMKAFDIIEQAANDFGYRGDPARFFMSLQKKCVDAFIPKEYSGGISILYLRLCMGWQI